MKVPRILIIAGSDSGGGAGIQADIKTVTMLGGHAMTAITAITAQNTLGVDAVRVIPAEMVLAQIDAVVSDIGVDAVKIGMLGSAETANAVAGRLEQLDVPIVFDPVMVATSGAELADAATIAAFERLMALASVVTPNLPELSILVGRQIKGEREIIRAATELVNRYSCAVLAKGGHNKGKRITDILIWPIKTLQMGTLRKYSERLNTRHTHGTGCTLASGLAAGLGGGLSIESALDRAVQYVHDAIAAAPRLGSGNGPLGHALATTPYHHLKAAQSNGDWPVESWDSVWGAQPDT